MGTDINGKELGPRIYQRKSDGLYIGEFTDRFGKRRVVSSKVLKTLKQRLDKAKYEDYTLTNIAKIYTVDQWFRIWIDDFKTGVISDRTIDRYERTYRLHLKDILGERKLCEITPLDIRQTYNIIAVGRKTIRNEKELLNAMFNQAVSMNLMSNNPAHRVPYKNNNSARKNALTEEQERKLLEITKDSYLNVPVRLQLWCGLRVGEALGLKSSDVDFGEKQIHICRTLHYDSIGAEDGRARFYTTPPKTKSSERIIPMTPRIEQTIHTAIENQSDSCEFLIANRRGKAMTSTAYDVALKKVGKTIGTHISSHTLRHTFCTNAWKRGIDPKALSVLMGHSSVTITADIYAHLSKEHLGNIMALMDDTTADTTVP